MCTTLVIDLATRNQWDWCQKKMAQHAFTVEEEKKIGSIVNKVIFLLVESCVSELKFTDLSSNIRKYTLKKGPSGQAPSHATTHNTGLGHK